MDKDTIKQVKPRKNSIGQKFGMLTVVEQVEDYVSPNGCRWAQYRCQCDCGNFVNAIGNDLTRSANKGHQPKTHCGCQTSKNRSNSQRKYNAYRIEGNIVIGVTNNTNEEFYNDIDDFELIKQYTWFAHVDDTRYKSLIAKIPGTGKHIKMTALLGCKHYDHINRNALDNRRENLRQATKCENMRNRSLFANNKSGVTGVHWDQSREKWMASVKINKKNKHLGGFVNKDDAIRARLEAEAQYYGEFAPQQHLFEQYDITVYTQQND